MKPTKHPQRRFLLVVVILCFFSSKGIAQCSDAGVCSVGEHTNNSTEFKAALDYLLGSSGKPDNITIQNINLTLRYSYFSVIIPYVAKSFDNEMYQGSINGIGDVIIGGSYSFSFDRDPYTTGDNNEESVWSMATNSSLTFDVASKFPTGSTNEGGYPLRYQNGLGTTDLILGATFSLPYYDNPNQGNWLFGLGFQMPFGISDNSIDSLKRGPDLLARISYNRSISDIGITGEILAIKRLTTSTLVYNGIYTTEQSPDPIYVSEIEIPNSDDLQINIKLSAEYEITKDIGIHAGVAVPILKREDNTDGLKRAYTVFLGFSFFN